ncbi:MAG: hypothetical protein JW821_20140 [Deltaproteobacteria bacterium]|nr:hypothetical protein [Deltaproteobacteria bacterium]
MSYIEWAIYHVDPILIAPYRWLDYPIPAWWLGTFVLGLWAALLGELTLAVAYRVNRTAVKERMDETSMYHQRSVNALKSGDKKSYKAINKLANEAFGKSFFLLMAMGMASLWPAFLAAAWLQERFGDIRFSFPYVKDGLNFVPSFLICYVLARIIMKQLKKGCKAAGMQFWKRRARAS